MAVKKLNAIEYEDYGFRTRVYHGEYDREKNILEYKEVFILEHGTVISRFETEGTRDYKNFEIFLFYPKQKFKTKGLENAVIIRSKSK